ncbi:hypothetical protein BGZ76_006978 [Entomortierella beljakovae]|nr:hypothetical protein BGZ76_006978 [Entomortierella beljakovae]
MDWSPSVSVDDNEAFSTTADLSNNSLIDVYCQQRREYIEPHIADRIADLCTLKLQQASSGRHHSLLRHVQLTCMLHRIRMQAFMRPVMTGYLHNNSQYQHEQQLQQQQQHQQHQHQSLAFEQDLSSQQPQGYDWSQESSLNSTNLSFDMLLGMGSPQSSVNSTNSLPVSTTASISSEQGLLGFVQPHQHHPLSSIPLISFTGEYATSPSEESFQHQGHTLSQGLSTSMSLSSIPTSPSQHLAQQPLAVVSTLPHQTYYELLMAANPNEPLSQLLSTNVTTSTTGILSEESSSGYAALDASMQTSLEVPVASDTSLEGSHAEQMLSSVNSNFAISSFQSAPGHSHQQTIPLTTKEIMDALSGQFPIQPVTPSAPDMSQEFSTSKSTVLSSTQILTPVFIPSTTQESDSMSPSIPECVKSENVEVNEEPTSTSSSNVVNIAIVSDEPTVDTQVKQEVTRGADCDMQSPPPSYHHEGDESDTSVTMDSLSETHEPTKELNMDVDLADLADITLVSPPSSPRSSNRSPKRTKSSPTARRSPRAQTRRSRAKSEAEPVIASNVEAAASATDNSFDSNIRTTKRRRASDEDASSSCSSPESSPPSPKTPPATLESHCSIHQRPMQNDEIYIDQSTEQQAVKELELDSKRPKTESGNKIKEIKEPFCSENDNGQSQSLQTADGVQEDAGILSPSLLARYPTRHSTRTLRRTSARLQSGASCGANTHHHHSNNSEPALLSTSSKATAA